jgi:N-acyl-D-amino-acid deacylase
VQPWGFGEALDSLVARGVSLNVASFVGATTLRLHEIGADDRAPTRTSLPGWRRWCGAPWRRARSA